MTKNQTQDNAPVLEQAFLNVSALRNATFEVVREQVVNAFQPQIEEAVALQLFGEADDEDKDKDEEKEEKPKSKKKDKDDESEEEEPKSKKKKDSDKEDDTEDDEEKPKSKKKDTDDESEEEDDTDDLDELTDEDLGDLDFDEEIGSVDDEQEDDADEILGQDDHDENIDFDGSELDDFDFDLETDDMDIDFNNDVVDIDLGDEDDEDAEDHKHLRFKKRHEKKEKEPELEESSDIDILDEEIEAFLNEEGLDPEMEVDPDQELSGIVNGDSDNIPSLTESFLQRRRERKLQNENKKLQLELNKAKHQNGRLNKTVKMYEGSAIASTLLLKKASAGQKLVNEFFSQADVAIKNKIYKAFDKTKNLNEVKALYEALSSKAKERLALQESAEKKTKQVEKPKVSKERGHLTRNVIREYARAQQSAGLLADLPIPGRPVEMTDADRKVVHEEWQRLAGIRK